MPRAPIVILLRCTSFDEAAERRAHAIRAASGERVCLMVDERNGPVWAGGFPKLGLSASAVAELGIWAPRDFAWRCGDYGFYLARRHYPDEAYFWMIEHDVRIAGDAARFFGLAAARLEIDFLAADLRVAEPRWHWSRAIASRDAAPYRCLFPITRLTARAADVLLAKRRQHSLQLRRRLFWPNDEAFVTTTVMASGLKGADFSAIDPLLYDPATFRYHGVFGEDEIAQDGKGRPILYHPVLSGEALEHKRARLQADARRASPAARAAGKVAALVNRRFAW